MCACVSAEVMLCCKVAARGERREGSGPEFAANSVSVRELLSLSSCAERGKRAGLVTWRLSLTLPHNELLQNGQETQRAGRPSHPQNPICQGQRKEGAESKVHGNH